MALSDMTTGFVLTIACSPDALGVTTPLVWKDTDYECHIDTSNKIVFTAYDTAGEWVRATADTAITDPSGWISVMMVFDGSNVTLRYSIDGVLHTDVTLTDSGVAFGTLNVSANKITIGYDGTNYFSGLLDGFCALSEDFSSYASDVELMLLQNTQTFIAVSVPPSESLSSYEEIYELIAGSAPTTIEVWAPLHSSFEDATGNTTLGAS